jgi:hypothetical protein
MAQDVRWENDIVKVIEGEYIPISPETMKPESPDYLNENGCMLLQPHQLRILNHVFKSPEEKVPLNPVAFDAAGGISRTKSGVLPYRTFVYSCPKKSGKTGLGAAVAYAWARVYGGEMYSIANAKEHAQDRGFRRVKSFLEYIAREKKPFYENIMAEEELVGGESKSVKPKATEMHFKDPYARFEAIPCAAGSEAGGFQTFTLWDEIWAYDLESLFSFYSEMQPIDTVEQSMRMIVTYAGYYGQSQLLWQIYNDVVKPNNDTDEPEGNKVEGLEDLPCYVSDDGSTFVYWDHERRMPWQTSERGVAYLEAQRNDPVNKLRPVEFKRLHENRWVASSEAFIDAGVVEGLMAEGSNRKLRNSML